MPIVKTVNKIFFKEWSRDMAYILGFFAADGTITKTRRGTSFWSIAITDKKLLYLIRAIIKSDHTIGERKGKESHHKTIYRLQIGSKEMVEDLEKLGFCIQKAKTLGMPDIPEIYFWDFIRGYFDGDGNVWTGIVHKERKKKTRVLQIALTSASSLFLVNLLEALRKNGGVTGSLYSPPDGSFTRIMFNTRDSLKIFKMMYNRETKLFLSRKKKVMNRFVTYTQR
jgi:intein/homing endonuclease